MSPGSAPTPGLAAIDRIIDAFVANDTAAIAAALDPKVTWHHNIGEGSPMEGTYHGSGAVAKLWDDILGAWEILRFEDVVVEHEGDWIRHRSKVRLRARESGLELSLHGRVDSRIEGGRIVEVRFTSATGGR